MDRLKNLPITRLRQRLADLGEPRFRTDQILRWVYRKRIDSFDAMTNISKVTKEKLNNAFSLQKMAVDTCLVSKNSDAVKFGFKLIESDDIVESVLLIDGKRRTACLSSQLGCGLNCSFCATGAMGFVRNLTLDEVLGQLVGINDYCAGNNDTLVTHIVFMGMGEALSNFDVFSAACAVISDNDCFVLSPHRITVSTAGVIPSIERLEREGPAVNLAISLNGHSNDQRGRYMPVNRTYPIEALVAAAREFAAGGERELTFEYVVIPGENDTAAAVKALTSLLHGISCKVNCIPINANPAHIGSTPSFEAVQAFADALFARGILATVRRSRGDDIDGACGQLAGKRMDAR